MQHKYRYESPSWWRRRLWSVSGVAGVWDTTQEPRTHMRRMASIRDEVWLVTPSPDLSPYPGAVVSPTAP